MMKSVLFFLVCSSMAFAAQDALNLDGEHIYTQQNYFESAEQLFRGGKYKEAAQAYYDRLTDPTVLQINEDATKKARANMEICISKIKE